METKIRKRGIITAPPRLAIASVSLLITLVAALIALPVDLLEYVTRAYNRLKTEKL